MSLASQLQAGIATMKRAFVTRGGFKTAITHYPADSAGYDGRPVPEAGVAYDVLFFDAEDATPRQSGEVGVAKRAHVLFLEAAVVNVRDMLELADGRIVRVVAVDRAAMPDSGSALFTDATVE